MALLFWSGSDLFSKMGSKSDDKYSHWKMVMAVGVVMGIHAIVNLCTGSDFKPQDMITYLPASFFYIASMTLGYVGLRYIMLSVSSPICNSSGAVACIMFLVLMKETMALPQAVAVVMICVAVFLLAVIEKKQDDAERREKGEKPDGKYTHSFWAIFLPIMYCILDALGTYADGLILDKYLSEDAGNTAYELTFLAMAVVSFIYVRVIRGEKIFIRKEKPKIAAAICETVGQFGYVYAIAANAVVAAPMISAYCMVSLLWARVILKEKLLKCQYVVIAMAITGIIILGIYDV